MPTGTVGEGTTLELANSYDALWKLWSSRSPHRANGGWWALSGFSIQMTVALERFVRAFLVEKRASAAAEVESLSDFLIAGDKLTLTQVKRTLTASTLGSALREAYEIISLCSPELACQIEFQIVCERCDSGLSVAVFDAQHIFPDRESYDPGRLALVRSLFVEEQPIRVMSNPRLSLRRTLLNGGVRDADHVARAALGDLFDSFDGRDREKLQLTLHKVMADILVAANLERRSPGRLLAPDCFASRPVGINTLFTRARPRLDDLVGDRFTQRPEQLAKLTTAAQVWLGGLSDRYAADNRKLPVLWLHGRPGDGKSILMLQLVEALVSFGRLASVIELLDTQELGGWLKSCLRWASDSEQAEIGFLDDLAELIDRSALDRLMDSAFYRGTPYAGLITCSTTDAYQALRGAERLSITEVTVPAPDAAEYETFRQWAGARLRKPITAREQDGRSLAAFMLALADEQVGDSNHAASANAEMFQRIRAAAAANALGFAAPFELLTEDDVARFALSWTTMELSAESEPDGLRLAHAEVIWPLYVRGVGAAALGSELGRDLARVLTAQLQAGRKDFARRLVGVLLNRRRLIEDKLRAARSEQSVIDVFNAAYKEMRTLCPSARQAPLLRLWLAARVSGKLTCVTEPDLRTLGQNLLSEPGVAAQDRTEIAVSLLSVGSNTRGSPFKAAISYLWRAKPDPILIKYLSRTLSRGSEDDHTRLALEWLEHNPGASEAGEVLACTITPTAPERLIELGYRFVERFLADPISGPVLRSLGLTPKSKRFFDLQDRWLRAAADPATAVSIYSDQLGTRYASRYAGRATAFMASHLDIRGGHELLARLLRCRNSDPRVQELVRRWLDANVDSSLATPLLVELVKCEPLATADLGRALQHIDLALPGSSYLFTVVAALIQGAAKTIQNVLRAELPSADRAVFDQAVRWRLPAPLSLDLARLYGRTGLGRFEVEVVANPLQDPTVQ
jgi:hypothetical protein